jgi:hypothetical protein
MAGILKHSAISTQQSAKAAHRKGRKERKGNAQRIFCPFVSFAPFAVLGLAECWVLIAEC